MSHKGYQMSPVHDKAHISEMHVLRCSTTNQGFSRHRETIRRQLRLKFVSFLPQTQRPRCVTWVLKVWSQTSLHLGLGSNLTNALASCKQIVKMKAHQENVYNRNRNAKGRTCSTSHNSSTWKMTYHQEEEVPSIPQHLSPTLPLRPGMSGVARRTINLGRQRT